VLGTWIGPSDGEGAKFWLSVLTELRNRGTEDVLIVCCDGLSGLPDAAAAPFGASVGLAARLRPVVQRHLPSRP
jgi:transposase-like protein